MPTRGNNSKLNLEQLRQLYSEGKSTHQIAVALQVNHTSVLRLLKRCGMELCTRSEACRRRWAARLSPELQAEVVRLYLHDQSSIMFISRTLGLKATTVRSLLVNGGIKIRPSPVQLRLSLERDAPSRPRRRKAASGYVLIKDKLHPRADANGWVREHIMVWEHANGKPLEPGWIVHHLNGIKDDNRPENLVTVPAGEHSRLIPFLMQRIIALEREVKSLQKRCNALSNKPRLPELGGHQEMCKREFKVR